jgi:hypothetical protein
MNIGNFNVANHLHLQKYGGFIHDKENFRERYITGIRDMFEVVDRYKISIMFLSEVTSEYYEIYTSMISLDKNLQTFFDPISGLMTIFFCFQENHFFIEKIAQKFPFFENNVDRLQIFNVSGKDSKGDAKEFTVCNIHGYGDPLVRGKYLRNTFSFINGLAEISKNIIVCGDFNSDLETMIHNVPVNFKVFEDYRVTSYHRYILEKNGEFKEKSEEDWFTKMDQLVSTPQFIDFETLHIFPPDFGDDMEIGYPYAQITDYSHIWHSDHALMIYLGKFKLKMRAGAKEFVM